MDRLSLSKLCEGMQTIRQTALTLLQDAQLLLEHERYPRAFLLAYTADEELSKITILFGAFARIKLGQPVDWKRVRKSFIDHDQKARGVAFNDFARVASSGDRSLTLEEMAVLSQLSDKAACELPKARMQALYCSFDGGRFKAPEDQITGDDARLFVEKASHALFETTMSLGNNPQETMARLSHPESVALMRSVFLDPRSIPDQAR